MAPLGHASQSTGLPGTTHLSGAPLGQSRVSADRLPEVDARLGRPHCVGDIQDRLNLKIGERSELGCGFG